MRSGIGKRLDRLEAARPPMPECVLDYSTLSSAQLATLAAIELPFDVTRASDEELRAVASIPLLANV